MKSRILFFSSFLLLGVLACGLGAQPTRPAAGSSEATTAPNQVAPTPVPSTPTQPVAYPPDDGSRFPARIESAQGVPMYGYIDRYGEVVIPPTFQGARRFYEGLAVVVTGNSEYRYIDRQGNFIGQDTYSSASPFSEGLAHVRIDNDASGIHQSGFIDPQGNFVIGPFKGDGLGDFGDVDPTSNELLGEFFHDGWWVPMMQGEHGVSIVDKNNNPLQAAKGAIYNASRFGEGLAAVCYFSNSGGEPCTFLALIDTTGNEVARINKSGRRVDLRNYFSGGLLAVYDGGSRVGFVNQQGQVVIPFQYRFAQNFSESLAGVWCFENQKWGFVDPSGRLVIPCQYDKVLPFSEGLAAIYYYNSSAPTIASGGYIDPQGKLVIADWYGDSFDDGLAHVQANKNAQLSGYIDNTGQLVYQEK